MSRASDPVTPDRLIRAATSYRLMKDFEYWPDDEVAEFTQSELDDAETPWLPIEDAPTDGTHILAADFSGKGVGFGGNPQQSYQCVVHWFQWGDGAHQEEWGWYPSTGAGENPALTNLTHWKPLEELARGKGEFDAT